MSIFTANAINLVTDPFKGSGVQTSPSLNEHLEGCIEKGVDVRIICKRYPASMAVAGEDTTPDGVLNLIISNPSPF